MPALADSLKVDNAQGPNALSHELKDIAANPTHDQSTSHVSAVVSPETSNTEVEGADKPEDSKSSKEQALNAVAEKLKGSLIRNGLWDEAYDRLYKDHAKLMEKYQECLIEDSPDDSIDSTNKDAYGKKLQELVRSRLDAMGKSKSTIKVGNEEVCVRDNVQRVFADVNPMSISLFQEKQFLPLTIFANK